MKAEVHFDDGDILPITIPCEDSFEAMNLLRDLIERDKAKKPTYKDSQFFCVQCGQELSIRGDYGYPFCRCGQRIDWK